QGAVEAGVLDKAAAYGGGDGGHIADVLHHGGDGDGGHDKDGGQVKFGQEEGLDAHRGGGGQAGEVDEGHHVAGGVQGGGPHGVGDQGHHVGAHHPQQDGDDLHHAL